jgi:hypothetical protein
MRYVHAAQVVLRRPRSRPALAAYEYSGGAGEDTTRHTDTDDTDTSTRHALGLDLAETRQRLEHTMSTTPKTPTTHDDRIITLEYLVRGLASDLVALALKTREVVGHTVTDAEYLDRLLQRERDKSAK